MARPPTRAHRPGRGLGSRRCGDPPPARLRQGVEELNRGELLEQHETLERFGRSPVPRVAWLAEGGRGGGG